MHRIKTINVTPPLIFPVADELDGCQQGGITTCRVSAGSGAGEQQRSKATLQEVKLHNLLVSPQLDYFAGLNTNKQQNVA